MTRVSVIVPAYNPGGFLEAAVRSVVAQTFSDWEVLVVDDGSAEDYSAVTRIHPAIRYFRQANAGPSVARNRGIREARGEYLAFLDADDLWLPGKLDAQVRAMDASPTSGMCHTGYCYVDQAGQPFGQARGQAVESYAQLLGGCCVVMSSVLARRECVAAVGDFEPSLRGPEDYDFHLRVARQYPVEYLPDVLVYYRSTPGSLSSDPGRMCRQSVRVLRRHRAAARRDGDAIAVSAATEGIRRLRRSYGCMFFDQCRQSYRAGQLRRAARQFAGAARLRPAFVLSSLIGWMFSRHRVSSPRGIT